MSDRKRRKDMTKYERARDWQERLSPRWWRGVAIAYSVSVVLFVVGAVIRITA